jgi:transcriptional regulator with XRE-family HTH domain
MIDEVKLRNILSQNIKRYRQRKGWSQAKLAEEMGISTNYLSDIETKRGWVSPLSLVNLANSLEIEVFELFMPEKTASADVLTTVNKCLDDFSTSLRISFEKALVDSMRKTRKNL